MSSLLVASGLGKSFDGKPVLDDVSLSLHPNEVICLIGKSGGGKTTLLRCLNLLDYIDTGKIEFAGQQVIEGLPGQRPPRWKFWSDANGVRLNTNEDQYRRHFGVVFQSFNLFPNKTVLQNLIEGPVYVSSVKPDEARRVARQCLDSVGMAGREKAYPNELSGGQQQRVAIARALAMKPDVLLLDEITSALDPPRVASVLDVIRKIRQDSETAMIVVTHHIEFAREIADRVCFLENGRIIEEGEPEKVFSNPSSSELQAFLESVRASR